MFLLHSLDLSYSIAGLGVGFLVGMTGMGGGSLMTPLLILVFGIHPVTAVGTDLLYAAATKAGGSLVHGLSGTVEWHIVRRLATGSVPASVVTLMVLSPLDLNGHIVHELVTFVLSGALLATAGALVFRRRILATYAARIHEMSQRDTAGSTVLVGAILGVVVPICSVGAGAIGVTMLVLLYPRLPMAKIVGTDIAHAVPLTLVAGIGHWMLGSVDWPILGSLLAGSLPGIVLGSYLSFRVPQTVLRLILAATLVVVASKLAVDELHSQLQTTAATPQSGMH